jgi:hypothetical protein
MPDATAAQVAPGPIPGRWVAEPAWPAPNVQFRPLYFGQDAPLEGALSKEPQPPGTARIDGEAIVGLGKVEWVPFAPTELPREQSPDDAKSLVFDTPALTGPLEILGVPSFKTRVAADQPVAHLAIRLCEVSPAGKSWLVSYGLLNLTHRGGRLDPVALEPGKSYDVEIALNFVAHRFGPGSRLRASISESLWPLVWPSPKPAHVTLELAATTLSLPVRAPPATEAAMPIRLAPPLPSDPKGWATMDITETGGEARVVETWPTSTSVVADIGETVSGGGPDVVLSMRAGEPLTCDWRAEQSARYQRPGWDVAVRAQVRVRSTAAAFEVEERTLATLNGETVADVKHRETIARDLG